MSLTHFIPDGYEEPGYIAEQPGLFPALRFGYRPMISEDRDTIAAQSVRKPPHEYHKILRAAIAARITRWDAPDQTGKPMPITPASVRLLRPRLSDRLYAIICGDSASDTDPTSAPAEQNEAADAALEAAISGRTAAEVKQEADAKN